MWRTCSNAIPNFALRQLRGIFVLVSEEDELVLANVVCELAPDRVRQVAHGATLICMKFGLDKAIQQAMLGIERDMR